MASIRDEYHRFLTELAEAGAPDDVKRIAHLILQNLVAISELGATRRARSTRLVPLALRLLPSTLPDLPEPNQIAEAGRHFDRLHELNVGPFRGFMREERFDLSANITLVYGANGSGKSSFCEALETALLGSISEAQAKRIDHETYCNNARLRRHSPPVVTATLTQENPARVIPNEEAYRFCFIEKNRLDDFGRIAARTPADQRQLIATLFGVDQFADFVRGFNQTIDEDLDLVGRQGQELARRRLRLASAEETIRNEAEKLQGFADQEAELANSISPGNSFSVVCEWLIGTETQQGRLPYVRSALDVPTPPVYGVSGATLIKTLDDTYRTHTELTEAQSNLIQRSAEVSYKQLYEAVIQLSQASPKNCPACGTSLDAVSANPFDKAKQGLADLAELAEIQSVLNQTSARLDEFMRSLLSQMTEAVQVLRELVPDKLLAANLPQLPFNHQGEWLQDWMNHDRQSWRIFLSLITEIERHDSLVKDNIAQRQDLATERQRLDRWNIAIEIIKAAREAFQIQLLTARATVARFEEENRVLISAAAEEGALVEAHSRVKVAYDGYLSRLKSYLDRLPARLLQGLGNRARDLYNAFNREDPQGDLLHELRLPTSENGKIELIFMADLGRRYDALQILSEGHIRCLGLAILLAKNITENCSFVIFDDVVNAIDDDHRNGIWRTFFEDDYLDGKQIILTSHADEFLHRIQQNLGVERLRGTKLYRFLPHLGEHELRIDTAPPSKNYVILATNALAAEDNREALRNSRAALEALTDQIWTWMGRHGDGRLELKLSGPRSPWELNNKCIKLRSALRGLHHPSTGIPIAISALDSLLQLNGNTIEWSYLNGGTHDSERDGEFDRAAVGTIVNSITSLDHALELARRGQ